MRAGEEPARPAGTAGAGARDVPWRPGERPGERPVDPASPVGARAIALARRQGRSGRPVLATEHATAHATGGGAARRGAPLGRSTSVRPVAERLALLRIAASAGAADAAPLVVRADAHAGRAVLVVARGPTVEALLDARAEGRDPLAPGEAVTLLAPVAETLAALAAAGRSHGAVAASTVVVDASGRPELGAWDAPFPDRRRPDDARAFATLAERVLAAVADPVPRSVRETLTAAAPRRPDPSDAHARLRRCIEALYEWTPPEAVRVPAVGGDRAVATGRWPARRPLTRPSRRAVLLGSAVVALALTAVVLGIDALPGVAERLGAP